MTAHATAPACACGQPMDYFLHEHTHKQDGCNTTGCHPYRPVLFGTDAPPVLGETLGERQRRLAPAPEKPPACACGHDLLEHSGPDRAWGGCEFCACSKFNAPAPPPPAEGEAGKVLTMTRRTPCKKCGESLAVHVLTRTLDDMVSLEPNWCGGILPMLDEITALRAEVAEARDMVTKLISRELTEKARADAAEQKVERLTRERDYSVKALADRVARVAFLEGLIREAPHDSRCTKTRYAGIALTEKECTCDCWKAKAEVRK